MSVKEQVSLPMQDRNRKREAVSTVEKPQHPDDLIVEEILRAAGLESIFAK